MVNFVLLEVVVAQENQIMKEAILPEIFLENDVYSRMALVESELGEETFKRGSALDQLYRAKFNLINGNIKNAKFYLARIEDDKSQISIIKKRYEATISFIEGDFINSLKILNDKRFYENTWYPQICLLKMIDLMALNDIETIKKEKDGCIAYTAKYSKNDQFWLDTMIKLKTKDEYGVKKNLITDISYTLTDDETSRLWLKTGLYLNKEKDLLDLLSELPESSFQSKRLREIVAFMYMRSNKPGDVKKALSFIDDVDSANAENIKGNINLKNKEFELAFGHFRLALSKKQDSNNSLERAIPLAWILNQWKDGIDMIDKKTSKSIDPRNKKAVRIAFLIRDKKIKDAEKELIFLKSDFKNQPPSEVSIMDSYVSILMGGQDKKYDKRKIEENTEKSCKAFDGISCWISLQISQWDNIGKTIKRDDDIFSDKDITIESLKEKKSIVPLKEQITIDQRDIEELDGEKIKIAPTK